MDGAMSLNFHREGSGPPLVLLHGIGFHWQAWRPVIGYLSADFDVIACDLPGFGRSQPLSTGVDPTIRAYADALAGWLAEMGLERPHVAGNSMGGAIALELADRGDVASATAFSPAGFWSATERRDCQLSLGAIAYTPRPLCTPIIALVRTAPGGRFCSRSSSASRGRSRPTRPSRPCATRVPFFDDPAAVAAVIQSAIEGDTR